MNVVGPMEASTSCSATNAVSTDGPSRPLCGVSECKYLQRKENNSVSERESTRAERARERREGGARRVLLGRALVATQRAELVELGVLTEQAA